MFWGKKNHEKTTYTTKHFYKHYKNISKNPVSLKLFNNILKEYFEYRMQILIFDNVDIRLSNRMGTIGIRAKYDAIHLKKDGTIRYFINWGDTNKLWKELYKDKTPEEIKQIKNKPVVYYTNESTNGKVYGFIWDKYIANFRYKSYYRFEPTIKWKRKLKDYIKNTKIIKYYEK